jgi:hypothetical protein
MTGLRIHLLNLFEELSHIITMGRRLVGTEFYLLLIAPQLRIATDIILLNHTERTDDAQGHLSHLEQSRHRIETSLIELVHQAGMQQVILMMSQGNLVAPQLLRQIKKLLTAVPRTEETWRLLLELRIGS